jgi:hypothetical protein
VLIGTVITTYATLRYSASQEQPQVLSAIDETNLALEKVLGFTVGYYGSIMQVTGDTSYAKDLTTNYLNSSLNNIADIQPEWGASFRLSSLDLSTNWFTNNSYSAGQALVAYDLVGLGIYDMSYSASCRLDVQISNSSSTSQVCLSVTEGGNEPLINLGEQNFKFYRYSNLTWDFATPSGELTTFSNGTYLIDIPSGIGSSSYVVQVTDTRGIMVAAASFSRITSTLMWNTTASIQGADYVDSNTTNIGTQNNFIAQQYGPDSIFDTLTEGASGSVTQNYYPSSYLLSGSTTRVSGSLTALQSDDSARMVFRSYASGTSAQTLYAQQDITSILGAPYYTFKTTSADASGITLTTQMSSSRVLLGKSVYSLQGLSSIPASTWTVNYRAWRDDPAVTFDNASSVEATTPAASVLWSHTTGTANNRLLIVAISVHVANGTPTTVSSVTYGGMALSQVNTTLYSATTPQVRTYIYRLVNPQSGTQTVTVNFAASTLYVCGATTYVNVDQTTPIQASQTATGSSTSPSVSVTATGTGRAVFGHLAGYRTVETSTQVTYVSAGDGSASSGLGYWPYTPTYPTPSYPSNLQANDLILLQVTVRDTFNTPSTPAGFTLLYGPDSTGTGRQWIYYKFATGTESGTITITIGGTNCKTARMYAFRNVATSNSYEGGGFNTGTGSTINAQSVTTTDTKRLAVSFVFVNDNNAVDSFTGETGGDWTEAVSEFTSSEGSDGCVQLQTATMASTGTITGGSDYMGYGVYDPWGVRAFALKPKTMPQPWIITEGSGQNNRWAKETNQYKGRGSDRLNVTAGTVTMSWSTDLAPNWACSAVVINPVTPVGHCDIDVLIRKADGTIRSTIATNVASSGNLTSTATTLSGTYPFGAYTVVDQTDYLEIDYYVAATTLSSANASLRVDDQTLALSNQTRIANVMLPSEYTSEVELIGTSDTQSWAQLAWVTDSSCTIAGVNVTVQLYNYTAVRYAVSGENGYNSTIMGTSDMTVTQTITSNPTNFRNGTGGWKLKFKAVSSSQFDLNVDLARYSPLIPNYALDIEEQWTNVNYAYPRQDLCIRTGTLSSEYLMVDVHVGSSWITVFSSLQPNTWNNVSVTPYISSQNFAIRFRDGNTSSDPTPDSWNIDTVLLNPQPDVDQLLSKLDHTVIVEFLQNGTMRWLGKNLQLETQGQPIPPVPVKAIHVNQTINGVNQEVPFQVEDWASEYSIPLGLTNNATVFSNRQMIVYLINVNVSKVTVWWNGSDMATQTPYASTRRYFTQDDPDDGILRNENLKLIFSSLYLYVDGFNSTSTSWSESGASPYLNDDSNNYIYNDGDNQKEGWFTLQDLPTVYSQLFASTNQDLGARVNIDFECKRDNDDYFEFRINDGITTYGPYRIDPPSSGSYDWRSYDITNIINTLGKLNNAKIEVTYRQSGWSATNVYIRRARLSLNFWLTSVSGNSTAKADFMRINMADSVYGAGIAYVIHHGTVRDIVQQEAEWNTGADNCPNVYANIVLTLPAQATYYTYQLRLMFINSTQPRTITDLCPIKLTTSIDQLQTENGTVNGIPLVANGTGSFYNFTSGTWTAHHWSQFISGSQGAGIMFTNATNQQLYVFDWIAKNSIGALKVDNSTMTIELLPVARYSANFNYALDVTWHGAVATFDSTANATPIYTMQGTAPTGLWLLVEYQPTITVITEN